MHRSISSQHIAPRIVVAVAAFALCLADSPVRASALCPGGGNDLPTACVKGVLLGMVLNPDGTPDPSRYYPLANYPVSVQIYSAGKPFLTGETAYTNEGGFFSIGVRTLEACPQMYVRSGQTNPQLSPVRYWWFAPGRTTSCTTVDGAEDGMDYVTFADASPASDVSRCPDTRPRCLVITQHFAYRTLVAYDATTRVPVPWTPAARGADAVRAPALLDLPANTKVASMFSVVAPGPEHTGGASSSQNPTGTTPPWLEAAMPHMVDYYPWAIAGQPGSPTGGAYDYRGDPNAFTEGESYSAKNREGEEGRDPATSEFPSGDLALRVNLSGQANVAPQACPNNSFNGTGLETNRLQGSADAPAYPPEVPAGLKKTGLLGCFVRFFYGTGPDQFDWIYHYAVGDVTLRRGQWDWMFADEIDESTPWRLPMGMNCPDFYVGTGITSMRNDADQDITSARFNDRVWLRGRHLEDYSIAQVFLQSPGGTVSKPVVDSRSTDALSFIVDTLAKGRFYVWVFVDLGPGSSPSFPSVRLTSAEFIAIDLN